MIRLVATYPAGNTAEVIAKNPVEAERKTRRLLRNAQWVERFDSDEDDPFLITGDGYVEDPEGPEIPAFAA